MTSLRVVDVYHGNAASTITAAAPGFDAIVIKASEATTADKAHGITAAWARNGGKEVGHYHYLWVGTAIGSQVDAFLASAAMKPGETAWVDVERTSGLTSTGTAQQWGASWAQRLSSTLTFAAAVRSRSGARCGLYCNKATWSALLSAASTAQRAALLALPLWIAAPSDPVGAPGIHEPWVMQQYGISGGLDRDYFAGDRAAWRALGVPAPAQPVIVAPPPTPEPAPPTTTRHHSEDDEMALLVNAPGNATIYVVPNDLSTKVSLDYASYQALVGTGNYKRTTLSAAIIAAIPTAH